MMPSTTHLIIGDVHGQFGRFKQILAAAGGKPVIQLGDLNHGFVERQSILSGDFRFIHGNHDRPNTYKRNSSYLGSFGYDEAGFFFVSGAWSANHLFNCEAFTWDGELSQETLDQALQLYAEKLPCVILSHDCPSEAFNMLPKDINPPDVENRTVSCLNQMLEIHHPKLWIFGHHHVDMDLEISGTRYVCLPILGTMEVNFSEYNTD